MGRESWCSVGPPSKVLDVCSKKEDLVKLLEKKQEGFLGKSGDGLKLEDELCSAPHTQHRAIVEEEEEEMCGEVAPHFNTLERAYVSCML